MKKFGNAIDKEREVSIQEIIYRLLGLPMSKFSAKVKFINTSHPEHRDGLMKGNLDDLGAEENVYHMSCHQYYENRPLNEEYDSTDWDNMSLAEFMSNYEYSLNKTSFDTTQPLQNDKGYIYKRRRMAVLRYFLKYEEPEDLARGLLILFHPFRSEMEEIHNADVLELLNENKEQIEEKRKLFENHLDLTDLMNEMETLQNDDESYDEEERIVLEETTSEFDVNKFV